MTEKQIKQKVKEIYKLLNLIPDRKRLKQMENWLRTNFITPYPVIVRVADLKKIQGESFRNGLNIIIRINKTIDPHYQRETLLHEWAHAMTWPNSRLEKLGCPDHSDEWGLAHAKVYRGWFDMGGFVESVGLGLEEEILKQISAEDEMA
jgi:hypothetical protein